MKEAHFNLTSLCNADLRGVTGVTNEDLVRSIINSDTLLPEDLEQYRDEALEASKKNLKKREERELEPEEPPSEVQ